MSPITPKPPGTSAAPAQCLVALPLRLQPGADLRRSVEAAVAEMPAQAGFVLSGIGSLNPAVIRLAGAAKTQCLEEDVELLTLQGSVAPATSHLHLSLALRDGRVLGGHAGYGCIVRTTAEVLIAVLPRWRFSREPDAATGYAELVVARI